MLDRLGFTRNGFKIAVTLPRKIAVTTIAARVAAEMNCRLGDEVGYVVDAHDQAWSERTRVVFFAESALLLELARDPQLSAYKVCMLDEAHERSVDFDVCLGFLRRLQGKRADLKLVISSATLDSTSFIRFLGGAARCALIVVEGRQFPVQIAYLQRPCADFITAACKVALELHASAPAASGDVLLFVPSRDDVEDVVRALQAQASDTLVPIGLHAGLSRDMQFRAIAPLPGTLSRRKVIVSTDVAETGVTVPDVAYVVDTMHAQSVVFDAQAGVDVVVTRPISKARADQRAGRAGRTRLGKCLRLCTEVDFNRLLPRRDEPEILRSDLVQCVLMIKALGVDALPSFGFMNRPPADALVRALDVLFALQALDDVCALTPVGETLAFMPCGARLGKVLLAGVSHGCAKQAVAFVAMMMSGAAAMVIAQASLSCLTAFGCREGDHVTLVNLFLAFDALASGANFCKRFGLRFEIMDRARAWRAHLESVLGPEQAASTCETSTTPFLRALVAGYFSNAAQLARDGNYMTSREARPVKLHPASILARFGAPPPWIVFSEAVLMSEHGSGVRAKHTTVRLVSAVDPRWLIEESPHFWMASRA